MEKSIDKALVENKGKVSSAQKKPLTKDVDNYIDEIRGFESDRVALAKSSAKTAWKVAAGASAVALMSVVAVALLTPLKEVEPYLMRVDGSDGSVSILRPLSDSKSISYGEVLDKYWSRKFIYARNGYDWQTVQNSYNLVNLMGSNIVSATYNNYIKAESSPVKVFNDKKRIKVEIQDVTFIPSSSDDSTLAQIRFSRNVINREGLPDIEYETTYWNATITFNYQATIKTADERELNPLGFYVTSYTEDRVLKK